MSVMTLKEKRRREYPVCSITWEEASSQVLYLFFRVRSQGYETSQKYVLVMVVQIKGKIKPKQQISWMIPKKTYKEADRWHWRGFCDTFPSIWNMEKACRWCGTPHVSKMSTVWFQSYFIPSNEFFCISSPLQADSCERLGRTMRQQLVYTPSLY